MRSALLRSDALGQRGRASSAPREARGGGDRPRCDAAGHCGRSARGCGCPTRVVHDRTRRRGAGGPVAPRPERAADSGAVRPLPALGDSGATLVQAGARGVPARSGCTSTWTGRSVRLRERCGSAMGERCHGSWISPAAAVSPITSELSAYFAGPEMPLRRLASKSTSRSVAPGQGTRPDCACNTMRIIPGCRAAAASRWQEAAGWSGQAAPRRRPGR